MRFTICTHSTTLRTFAPTTEGRSKPSDTTVAEVVTFKLTKGASTDAFLTAAQDMSDILSETGSVLSRTLSKGHDDVWVDHITWTTMSAATTAAQSIMKHPQAAPFLSLIDPDTVEMRHNTILFELE